MRYIHRIVIWATQAEITELRELGMKLDCGEELYGTAQTLFLVDEDHPHWPIIHARLREWEEPNHIVLTEFSPRELDAARFLRMTAWDNGYALPMEDFKFFEVTFDVTHACPRCRFGKIQNAPFRIKMEPKWGRKGIMTLNQAYDELFVPPAVWETIFKPFGIGCQPVANRHGKLLQTVVQLVIEEQIDLLTEVLKVRELCKSCGRPKYDYPERGRFPSLAQEPSKAIAKTRQTFYDGLDIVSVIVSQELRRAIVAHKLRGAEFVPVESHLDAFEA